MIQVGIFTGYFPYTLEETAKKIRSIGFNTVQLDVSFKDIDLSTNQINSDKCKNVYMNILQNMTFIIVTNDEN